MKERWFRYGIVSEWERDKRDSGLKTGCIQETRNERGRDTVWYNNSCSKYYLFELPAVIKVRGFVANTYTRLTDAKIC